MIIGTKNTVGIECYNDTENTNSENVIGRMCIWINNIMLGNLEEPACMLGVTKLILEKFLENCHQLDSEYLNSLDDQSLSKYVNSKLYSGSGGEYENIVQEERDFFKYDFLTNGGESLDSFKSFIVKDRDSFRILFTDKNGNFYAERVFGEELIDVINRFIEWMNTCKFTQSKNA